MRTCKKIRRNRFRCFFPKLPVDVNLPSGVRLITVNYTNEQSLIANEDMVNH